MRVQNGFFITGSEDGTVSKYTLDGNKFEEILERATLPIRDVALSPDGNWIAVASEYVAFDMLSDQS
jgi:chromosome transmission fidelity protein 4